jgi:CRP-like cAMP-binding protein
MHETDRQPLKNNLLAQLSRSDFELLSPYLITAQIERGTSLDEPGVEIEQVYFPLSGMISLLFVTQDATTVETGTIGRDGALGAMSGLGLRRSPVRAVVQLPMVASRIASKHLQNAVASSKAIADMCIRYNEFLLKQARVAASCNAFHVIEARFCRLLLQAHDHAESDTLELTQEVLADRLGVRRTSISEEAIKIQKAGAISYSRGAIKILDIDKLKIMACECYETLGESHSGSGGWLYGPY